MGYLLLAAVVLPSLGVVALDGPVHVVRRRALAITLVVAALAVVLIAAFPAGAKAFAVCEFPWFQWSDDVNAAAPSIALDGLGLWFFGLTALLTVVSVLVSWEAIVERPGAFYALLLLLETGMLGVFVARDVILFYVFFEFTLIPLFFLIGIWGSEERRLAATKFFLFTLAGSVLTFLGLLTIVLWCGSQGAAGGITTSIPELSSILASKPMDRSLQIGVFLLLFIGFAIKVPLFPLHTWLPLAHVQAPTAGSVLLAGVLLKVGVYGFARFAMPMTPAGVTACAPWMLWLSTAGILYGALVALAQTDIKRLIAYSSVSHLGFCMLGLFSLTRIGAAGGVLQAVNHGLSTGGLFAVVGMLYERYHTRRIRDLGGLAQQTPRLAAFTVVLTLASIGLPGLNGFAGEFPILQGMFQRAWHEPLTPWGLQYRMMATASVAGVVLGAWYMLELVRRVFFGPLRTPHHHDAHGRGPQGHGPQGHGGGRAAPEPETPRDLSLRETAALVPLVVFIVWIGVYPAFFLDRMGDCVPRPAVPREEVAPSDAKTRADAALQTSHVVGPSGDRLAATPLRRTVVSGRTSPC